MPDPAATSAFVLGLMSRSFAWNQCALPDTFNDAPWRLRLP